MHTIPELAIYGDLDSVETIGINRIIGTYDYELFTIICTPDSTVRHFEVVVSDIESEPMTCN